MSADDIVWQFPYSIALLGTWQLFHGYCILVSRRHATELSQLSDEERQGYLAEMCLLARAIEDCFQPHKLNYELLGNQVAHLHWHLFPRYQGDPQLLRPVWFALDQAETNESDRRGLQNGPLTRRETAALLRQKLSRPDTPVRH
jgi:diadenosine tetraphosphate (Ap4A) HIT family hydrolase